MKERGRDVSVQAPARFPLNHDCVELYLLAILLRNKVGSSVLLAAGAHRSKPRAFAQQPHEDSIRLFFPLDKSPKTKNSKTPISGLFVSSVSEQRVDQSGPRPAGITQAGGTQALTGRGGGGAFPVN